MSLCGTDGQTNDKQTSEDRATQPMEAGGWVSQFNQEVSDAIARERISAELQDAANTWDNCRGKGCLAGWRSCRLLLGRSQHIAPYQVRPGRRTWSPRWGRVNILIKISLLVGKDQVPWTFKVLLNKLARVRVSCAWNVPDARAKL